MLLAPKLLTASNKNCSTASNLLHFPSICLIKRLTSLSLFTNIKLTYHHYVVNSIIAATENL